MSQNFSALFDWMQSVEASISLAIYIVAAAKAVHAIARRRPKRRRRRSRK